MANTGDIKYSGNSGGGLDFEVQLWAAADKMRGHMDAPEYKHVCLGLSLLAGSTGRSRNLSAAKVAAAPRRVRRTHRHLCHDHQTGEGIRLIGILPSSFCLQTSPVPPFNMCDWGSENLRQDVRWKFGMPPVNNANYGWIQLFHSTLNENGRAGFIMANSASDTRSSEQDRPVIKLANRPAERVRTLFTSPDERGLLEEAPNLYAKVGIK